MGHATVLNISKCFNKMIRKNGTTIKEVVDELERTKQEVYASEGAYGERYMLSLACDDVVYWLYHEHRAIEPMMMNAKQKKIYKQWLAEESESWDCGDDGNSGEYGIFDSIKWKALKKRLPLLSEVTH